MRAAALLLAAALAGACGSSISSPDPSGTPGTPLDPSSIGVTCGGVVFHPDALERTGTAHLDPDPPARALRAFLDGAAGVEFEAESWVRVGETGSEAHFLGRSDPDRVVLITVAGRDSGWTFVSGGDCQPEIATPAGVGRAGWRLDPGFPDPAPEDRIVHLLINERSCAGGTSPEGRVQPPLIVVAADRITIAILVEGLRGPQTCQGNPDFALEVELPEAVAGRALFDGAVFPPRGPMTTEHR